MPAWPADRSHTRTGPVEADGAVDAQNAPTAPWKTLRVFHELPQGFPHQITHDKPRKSPESYWETRIDPSVSTLKGLITATNRNLSEMVASGEFREDLYYRLNVMTVEMPPLRERKEDINALAMTFIRRFAGELRKKVTGLDPAAEKLLRRYNWPGNIRELENSIERAVLLTEGELVTKDDLRLGELSPSIDGSEVASVVKIPPTDIALEEIERQAVVEALTMSSWIQKDAAELLSITPRVMNYKIKTLGIALPRQRRTAAMTA